MYYLTFHTVPPQTLETDPYEYQVAVVDGILSHVDIGFPQGCAGLAHLQLYYKHHQLYPTNPDQSFAWDGNVFSFDDDFPIYEHPYTVTVRAWNDDDSYEHTLMVGLSVTSGAGPVELPEAAMAGWSGAPIEGELPY